MSAQLEEWKYQTRLETQQRNMLLKFYKMYWNNFLSKLNCSERSVLTEYKVGSYKLNSLLIVFEEPKPFRMEMEHEIVSSKCCVSFINEVIEEEIRNLLKSIRVLETLFLKAPRLAAEGIVFRGIGPEQAEGFKSLKKGDLYKPKNFVSTSLNVNTATRYLLNQFDWKERKLGIIIKFILPQNTPFVLLPGQPFSNYNDVSSFKEFIKGKKYALDHYELVLNKNSIFKIVKIENIQLDPSKDFFSESYEKDFYVRLFTLKLIESEDTQVQINPKNVVETLKFVEIKLEEKI